MMKIQLLTLLVICLLLSPTLACDSAFDLLFADSSHPSDATLETNFYKHESDLNLLALMAIEDTDMIRIAPDFTWHKDNADGNASKAALDFSDERYDEYKQIFRKIGKNNGILNYQPDQMLVLASSKGLVTGGSSKGYAYLPTEPSELQESLDNFSFKDSKKRYNIVYKRLKGNWYLFYEVS